VKQITAIWIVLGLIVGLVGGAIAGHHDFHRARIKQLRRNGILAMDIFVSGVLEPRLVTITGHLYNFMLKMSFSGNRQNPVRMLQIGKVKSQQFVSSRHMFTISPVYGILVSVDMGVSM
jgi:hypothetical protein